MKVIIVDDEKRARVSLHYLISEFLPEVEIVAECDGIPNAVKSIHKHKPDLVFLDIEMPGHSGLEILDFFDEKDLNFGIIFTTAYQAVSYTHLDVYKRQVMTIRITTRSSIRSVSYTHLDVYKRQH